MFNISDIIVRNEWDIGVINSKFKGKIYSYVRGLLPPLNPLLEVCTAQAWPEAHTRPGPVRWPDWAGRWKEIFPMSRAGPGTWREIFWMGRHMRGDFSNRQAKREMSFLTAESGYKKRKTNCGTRQSVLTKQRPKFWNQQIKI